MAILAITSGALGIIGITIAIWAERRERYRQELAELHQYRRYFRILKGDQHD